MARSKINIEVTTKKHRDSDKGFEGVVKVNGKKFGSYEYYEITPRSYALRITYKGTEYLSQRRWESNPSFGLRSAQSLTKHFVSYILTQALQPDTIDTATIQKVTSIFHFTI